MDRLCQKTHISNIELLSLLLYGYYTQVMRQTLQLDYIFRETITIPAMSWMGCVQYDVGVGCHNIAMNHTTNAYVPCAWAYKLCFYLEGEMLLLQ